MVKEFETIRLPGLRFKIFGRSLRLISGKRNIVITVAWEKSLSNRSAFGKTGFVGHSLLGALRFDSFHHLGIVFDAERFSRPALPP